MVKNQNMIKYMSIAAICAGLAACGGGGGGDSDSSQAPYKDTVAGPGTTVVDAEASVTSGTINYNNYNMFSKAFDDPAPLTQQVAATVNFNTTTKAGSIQFPALGGTGSVSTADGYATTTWGGPFTTGMYKFNGNVLMGCNTSAAIPTEATQVYVSNSLERVLGGGAMDVLDGTTFDVYDCSIMQNAQTTTMKFNTDGSLTMTMAARVLTRNEKINMLNPEQWHGTLIDGKYFAGQVFRFGKNGVTKHVIVFQTLTTNINSRFTYHIAIQR